MHIPSQTDCCKHSSWSFPRSLSSVGLRYLKGRYVMMCQHQQEACSSHLLPQPGLKAQVARSNAALEGYLLKWIEMNRTRGRGTVYTVHVRSLVRVTRFYCRAWPDCGFRLFEHPGFLDLDSCLLRLKINRTMLESLTLFKSATIEVKSQEHCRILWECFMPAGFDPHTVVLS